MLIGEAILHYGIDGHELLAYVSSGELCALCYEHFGDCEHTKENGMEDWMRKALSGFIDEHWAEFEKYLAESGYQSPCVTTGLTPIRHQHVMDPASEIMDELRSRE